MLEEYGIELIEKPEKGHYEAVVLAVKHKEFVASIDQIKSGFMKKNGVFFDIKEVGE